MRAHLLAALDRMRSTVGWIMAWLLNGLLRCVWTHGAEVPPLCNVWDDEAFFSLGVESRSSSARGNTLYTDGPSREVKRTIFNYP